MRNKIIKLRETVKWGFLGAILILSFLHLAVNKEIWAPLDAYCPLGGLESIWKLATQGSYLEKIQPSNLALGLALVLTTLLFGGVFCGWICPLGTLQDGLNRLGRFFKVPQINIPASIDRYLRWFRYPVLAIVLLESFRLAKLWFADYDPFRIIFGLHWIFEPSGILLASWLIGGGLILLSLFLSRPWCKYLCPLGLIIQWLARFSWFKVRWDKAACRECDLCSKKCPLNIDIRNTKLRNTDCNGCQECIIPCPAPEALAYKGLTGIRRIPTVAGVILFTLILMAAQGVGWWNPQYGSNPESIRGWMTLGRISATYGIPIDEIRQDIRLPETADAETELRTFERTISGFEMDQVRRYVAQKIGRTKVAATDISHAGKEKNESDTNQRKAGSPEKPRITPAPKLSWSSQPAGTKETLAPNTGASSTRTGDKSQVPPRDPEEIKGFMSLKEISEGWRIAADVLVEKLGLPKDVDLTVPIRDLHAKHGVGGEHVRKAVKEILGL